MGYERKKIKKNPASTQVVRARVSRAFSRHFLLGPERAARRGSIRRLVNSIAHNSVLHKQLQKFFVRRSARPTNLAWTRSLSKIKTQPAGHYKSNHKVDINRMTKSIFCKRDRLRNELLSFAKICGGLKATASSAASPEDQLKPLVADLLQSAGRIGRQSKPEPKRIYPNIRFVLILQFIRPG